MLFQFGTDLSILRTKSESADKAWQILLETVYKSEYNTLVQGAPESSVNSRPAPASKPASSRGNAVICYDKEELIRAARYLTEEYDKLKSSAGYRYDLISLYQQVLSNLAQDVHLQMADAFTKKIC